MLERFPAGTQRTITYPPLRISTEAMARGDAVRRS